MKRTLRLVLALGAVGALTQLGACAYQQPYGQPYGSGYGSYSDAYSQPQYQAPAEAVSYVEAPVLSATPIYQQVQVARPRQECRQVVSQGHPVAGTLIGAALGGLVGNQFGRGSGNAAMTAAGAVAGAMAGNSVGAQSGGQVQTRCRTVNDYVMQRQASGYDVAYRYDGETYHTHSNVDPGSTIRVRVAVSPTQ